MNQWQATVTDTSPTHKGLGIQGDYITAARSYTLFVDLLLMAGCTPVDHDNTATDTRKTTWQSAEGHTVVVTLQPV